ncbi:hypothetical protein CLOSTMETH_00751 [[Clostridium] methylpentosum DSM 5476]|uniref:Uncharacterized protein n=1 Tax=[Clostridium] methylpentosum DSM 5476 TaxID=537013 RepID=C0EA97_9FIRM|nr:hypothetical protein CLOSTMETH_00751 [[Clostridium] methylpentosum DSM 5476]
MALFWFECPLLLRGTEKKGLVPFTLPSMILSNPIDGRVKTSNSLVQLASQWFEGISAPL